MTNKEKILGVLNVSDTTKGVLFSEADLEMVSVISDQAVMALDNIRSYREREEQNRVRFQLERYVSPEVSQLLVESKKGLLDIGRVTDLTILFADIRNFTFLVQQLPPDKLRLFLNSFFEIYSSAVFANQGMLDKFIGDAALAIFGAPVKIENSVAAAVDSSLRIMKEFEQLRAEWEGESSVYREVGLGIGISKGPVFLGNVGSESRMDYTVIGTDVNIAQRLASETEAGQILITESVKDSLGGSYQLGMPKNLLIRGMKSEITVYSLIY